MKTIAIKYTMFIMIFALCACKEDKKEPGFFDKVKETKETISNTSTLVDNVEKSQKLIKKLAETTPLSKDTFKNWMPEQLGDLERTKFKINSNTYVNSIKLTYKLPKTTNGKQIQIEVIDGAGNGSGVVYIYYLADGIERDSEDQTGYERTEKRDGITILETYKNEQYGNQSRMKFLYNERFAINATGFRMKPDELWGYIKKLRLQNLK